MIELRFPLPASILTSFPRQQWSSCGSSPSQPLYSRARPPRRSPGRRAAPPRPCGVHGLQLWVCVLVYTTKLACLVGCRSIQHSEFQWDHCTSYQDGMGGVARELSYHKQYENYRHKIIFGQCRVRWSGRRGKPPSRARPAALPPSPPSCWKTPEPPPLACPRLLRGRGPPGSLLVKLGAASAPATSSRPEGVHQSILASPASPAQGQIRSRAPPPCRWPCLRLQQVHEGPAPRHHTEMPPISPKIQRPCPSPMRAGSVNQATEGDLVLECPDFMTLAEQEGPPTLSWCQPCCSVDEAGRPNIALSQPLHLAKTRIPSSGAPAVACRSEELHG